MVCESGGRGSYRISSKTEREEMAGGPTNGQGVQQAGDFHLVKSSWVRQHAYQAERMLCGGLDIIGVYIADSAASLRANQAAAREIVYEVGKCVPMATSLCAHITIEPRKYSWTTIDTMNRQALPKAVQAKGQRFTGTWHSVECKVLIERYISLPDIISPTSMKINLARALNDVVDQQTSQWMASIDGFFPLGTDRLESLTGQHHTMVLYQPLGQDVPVSIDRENTHTDTSCMVIKGEICCIVYAPPSTDVAQMLMLVREDIQRSLEARVGLMIEDWDQGIVPTSTEDKHWAPPRRVCCAMNGLGVCDYMFDNEPLSDAAERIRELMGASCQAKDLSTIEGLA
eukprot:Ihof_evm2s641 gene=Ihof_evmTU2s641